jgi:hypothetical protein
MESNLKVSSSWSQLKAVERASERVRSWPEWKRTAVSYRMQNTTVQSAERKGGSREEKVFCAKETR